jgi:hypothetical protein
MGGTSEIVAPWQSAYLFRRVANPRICEFTDLMGNGGENERGRIDQ